MGHTIADVVPIAIGIAISPLPVVAVVLVLFSDRATAASIAFVAGWFGALVAVPVIGTTVVSSTTFRAGSSADTGSGWVLVALGAAMTIAGAVLVARSMHEKEAPTTPDGDAYVVAGVFALFASVTVILPVAVFLTMRTRVKPLLEVTTAWLIDNNQVIMAVLILVLGFVVAMKGVGRLVD